MTDYSQQYFTIESLEDGNVITLTIGANVPSTTFQSFSYSIDNGANWTTTNNVSSTTQTISFSLDKGHAALCKGLGSRTAGGYQSDNAYYSIFSSTKTFIVYGNISSLILGDNYSTNITSPNMNNLFRRLFYGCTTIISAENLILPYVLVNGTAQYAEMFVDCTSLTKAPKLPSESLTEHCYYYMFDDTAIKEVICLATSIPNSNSITNWLRNTPASGTFYKHPSMTSWPSGASGIPSGWTISDYYDDYSQQYFTVQSQEDSNTITFSIPAAITTSDMTSISYSVDGGINWTTTTINGTAKTVSVSLNKGKTAIWKGIAQHLSNANNTYCNFSATNNYIVYGNAMSLLYGENYSGQNALQANRTFNSLFYGNTSLIDANNLVLPATTILGICYYCMFKNCTNLLRGPKELPATEWDVGSTYEQMFYGCSSLIEAPILRGTKLGSYAYSNMFNGCSSLTKAPELPATIAQNNCYREMFKDCVSLTEAPAINLTYILQNCCKSMFQGCTGLTKAPILKIAVLAERCYEDMFHGCTSLKEVTCLATDISATNCTNNWLYQVSATGTFYKHPSMTSWGTGNSGIPSGWTTKDYMMLTINGKVPAAVKFVQNGVTHDLDYLKFGNNLVWQKTT